MYFFTQNAKFKKRSICWFIQLIYGSLDFKVDHVCNQKSWNSHFSIWPVTDNAVQLIFIWHASITANENFCHFLGTHLTEFCGNGRDGTRAKARTKSKNEKAFHFIGVKPRKLARKAVFLFFAAEFCIQQCGSRNTFTVCCLSTKTAKTLIFKQYKRLVN